MSIPLDEASNRMQNILTQFKTSDHEMQEVPSAKCNYIFTGEALSLRQLVAAIDKEFADIQPPPDILLSGNLTTKGERPEAAVGLSTISLTFSPETRRTQLKWYAIIVAIVAVLVVKFLI